MPVLAKALAKTPDERFGEAREMLAAMRAAESDTVPLSSPHPLASAPAPLVTVTEPLHASAPAAVPASVVTEVDGLPPVAPKEEPDAALPRAFDRSGARRWLPFLGIGALMTVLALGWALTRRGSHPSGAAGPPPAVSTDRGTVVIDALPWGEVERIVDDAGRPWPLGADRYTPFVASLPPGDYVISLRHPEVAEPARLRITVRASQFERRVVALREIDVDEYLQKAGF